ncbi:hypothetical protein N781_14295 [Pontibacillus halophilus JSM 076056 = DSM 19796]|uniref:Uncharacterized protein n=1 Tax=Pontibacillus halophilus JSM 076056 = DSM 19796 TaxID=1385510 RepID=A0A0A5GIH3_9BACI|nr:hypothetical protein [Pontibacillus halophilus]KGX93031.1 hypothetical protein N781_14295 [Pontibacillus halophilus JSM 076056 = DSM 19796]
MEECHSIFKEKNYMDMKVTSKSILFQHNDTGDSIYLLPNKEITIVLNPTLVEGNAYLLSQSTGHLHNTSFREFPKRINKGDDNIHYGYSFKFQTTEELAGFLELVG